MVMTTSQHTPASPQRRRPRLFGGPPAAPPGRHHPGTSADRDLTGKVGGPDGIEIHQVTLPPGQAAGPHTVPAGRRYITSSRIAFEPDGHLAQELRAGSALFEPAGAHPPFRQRVGHPATFIACYLVTGDQPLIQPL